MREAFKRDHEIDFWDNGNKLFLKLDGGYRV